MTHIFDNESYLPLFHYSSTLIVIITSLYCCIVRNFHLCRPFDKQADYFYPSRKIICWYFLVILFLVPYLFHLESLDTWLFFRCFYILYLPSFGSVVLRNYFFINVRLRIIHYTLSIGLPVLLLSPLWIIGCDGGDVLRPYYDIVSCVALILSIVVLIDLVLVTTKLMHIIQDYMYGEYSNEEDFPARFGVITANISVSLWVLAIIVILVDNQIFAAACSNIVTVILFVLLIAILHPQRAKCALIEDRMVRIIEEKRKESLTTIEEEHEKHVSEIPSHVKKDIEGKIRKLVIDGKLYLNPNFNKTELVTLVGTNRTYLSEVLRDSFGSFYSFINKLRIEYAAEYSREHPTATNSEIAAQSGFGSVRTYTRIRSLYNNGEL